MGLVPGPTAVRLYLAGAALTGAAHTVTFTLMARYLDALGLTKTQVGVVLSADAWGKVLVALPAAWLLARRPARGVFLVAALVGGGAYMVLPSLRGVAALAAPNGVAEAVRTLAAVVGAFLAGRFVAGWQLSLGGEAAATGVAIRAAGATAAAAALVYWRIQDRPSGLSRETPLLPLLRAHRGVLLRFSVPQFLIGCGSGFCIPFLPLYFKDRFDLAPGTWGDLFAGGQVMMSVGFLLTPHILRRLGFVRSIVAIELSSIPFFLLLAYTTSLPLAMLAYLVRGSLMNSTHPLHKNLMMQATPPGAREVQNGINATLWGLGWVVGPSLAGRVLDATGDDYAVLMVSTVGLYLVAAALTFILLRPVEQGSVTERD